MITKAQGVALALNMATGIVTTALAAGGKTIAATGASVGIGGAFGAIWGPLGSAIGNVAGSLVGGIVAVVSGASKVWF